jgi:hypothetical protein
VGGRDQERPPDTLGFVDTPALGQSEAVEEFGPGMVGRDRRGAVEGELGGRAHQPAAMDDERVAEPDPEIGVARVRPKPRLDDLGGALRVAVAIERVGDGQPAVGGVEPAEQIVPDARELAFAERAMGGRPPRAAGEPGPPLPLIAGEGEQQGGRDELEPGAIELRRAPQADEHCQRQHQDEQPAHQPLLPPLNPWRRKRPRTSHRPASRKTAGAAHKGQVSGSTGGL